MKLKLVKQGELLGTKCDFYLDESSNIYMSRTQIGYALQYKDPSNAVLWIHQRHYKRLDAMSIEVKGCQVVTPYPNKDRNALTYMYIDRGIYEICRHSKQKIADSFYNRVYETISSIRKNGYFIASEEDDKWLGTRWESKQARKYETDQIKLFVEYAKQQGNRTPERYYIAYTNLVNNKLGLGGAQRDNISQETLMELKGLETLVKMKVRTLMNDGIPYKIIYQEVKKMVNGNIYHLEQGDRDCSSAIISAYEAAGISCGGATYTGNMRSCMVGTGNFRWHPMSSGYVAQPGDVYLNELYHTAMCTSAVPDLLGEFSISETGGIDGAEGDQTGNESHERAYYNYPWDVILECINDEEDKPVSNSKMPKQIAGNAANNLGFNYRAHCQRVGTLPVVHDG